MDADFVFTVSISNLLKVFSWFLAVRERFFHKISFDNCQTQKILSKCLCIFWHAEVSVLKYWTPWFVVPELHVDHVNISDIWGNETHRTY